MKERGIFNFIFWREGLGSGLATTECLMLVIIVLVLSGEARCDTLSEIQVLAQRIDSGSFRVSQDSDQHRKGRINLRRLAGGSDAAGMTKVLRLVSLARLMPAKPMAAVTSLTDPSPTR